ncbi:MAG: Crp/Fnr family transcriptional regulator [Bacteroidales bacterium]|nr:Crp/Fnr family transcriptional regulator [Bacteroidales bacterium]
MKRKCETCTHHSCFINKYCSEEWKPIITFNKTTTDYPAGTTIFSEGESVTGIYEIYAGKIKVVSSYGNGRERIISFAKREQILGYHGLGGNMIYPVTAITLEASQVTFIPIDIFYKAVKANPDMALFLVKFFADQLKASETRMKLFAVMTALEKVASALLTIVNSFGFDEQEDTMLGYTPSRKDIANLSGTTYETVIRVLAEFEKTGVIKLEGKSIRILKLSFLKGICERYKF